MEPGQFARLVQNFKTDGRMTGTVTVCQLPDGGLEILSGHHRTEAAIEAGFDEIDVVVITSPLDESRKTAIQISHNAISGQDNQSLLAKMYEGLDLDAKKFSGLTDDILAALGNLSAVSIGSLTTEYEELRFSFLPEDKVKLDAQIDKLKKSGKAETWAARLEDFDKVFDTLVRVKHGLDVLNNALAILLMAELAAKQLDEIEAAKAQEAGQTAAAAPAEPLPETPPETRPETSPAL